MSFSWSVFRSRFYGAFSYFWRWNAALLYFFVNVCCSAFYRSFVFKRSFVRDLCWCMTLGLEKIQACILPSKKKLVKIYLDPCKDPYSSLKGSLLILARIPTDPWEDPYWPLRGSLLTAERILPDYSEDPFWSRPVSFLILAKILPESILYTLLNVVLSCQM
jgi:hypothetical protein